MESRGSFKTSPDKHTGSTKNLRGMMVKAVVLLSVAFVYAPAGAQNGVAGVKRDAGSASSAELAEARRAIDEGNARAVRAWATGDAELFASVFADEGLELRPDGSVVRGRRPIVELVKASMKRLGPGVELTVKTTGVWLDGGTAYESGKSVYKYTQEGQPKTFETLFVSVWKKQKDGAWKLYVDMPVPRE